MYLFIFFLLFLVVISIALFTELAFVTLNLNTDNRKIRVNVFWLSRTISVQFQKTGASEQIVSVFL